MKKYLVFLLLLAVTFTMVFAETGAPANMGLGGSLDSSSVKVKYLDVSYATKSATQKLDIYLPNTGKGPFPVIIAIHGGGFKFGDKKGGDLASMFEGVNNGYAVVSVNYRLSGEAKWPAQINDVKAAIKFIRANAKKYNLNPNKIATWGSSAGGNLSALAGTSGDVKELEDASLGNTKVSSKVQAVVDWYGPIDFLKMDEQWALVGIDGEKHSTDTSFESAVMGKNITLVPELVKTSNPENYINKNNPPFYIQHGTTDNKIPSLQGFNFSEKLKKVLGKDKVIFEYIKDNGHGGAGFESKDNLKKIFAFLDKYLK